MVVVTFPSSSFANKKNSASGPTFIEKPIFSASFITLFKLHLGHPSNGVPSALYISQINLAELIPSFSLHGKIWNVFLSGWKNISEVSMLLNPLIEEPSNMISLFNAFSMCCDGMVIFFTCPFISTNCNLMNLILYSFIKLLISSSVKLLLSNRVCINSFM